LHGGCSRRLGRRRRTGPAAERNSRRPARPCRNSHISSVTGRPRRGGGRDATLRQWRWNSHVARVTGRPGRCSGRDATLRQWRRISHVADVTRAPPRGDRIALRMSHAHSQKRDDGDQPQRTERHESQSPEEAPISGCHHYGNSIVRSRLLPATTK
jgi:hypothetical protein